MSARRPARRRARPPRAGRRAASGREAEIDAGRVLVGGAPAEKARGSSTRRTDRRDRDATALRQPRRREARRRPRAASSSTSTAGACSTPVRRPAGSPTACCSAGAASVVAVDVGYGQLHERLRADPRVEVRERINVRALGPATSTRPPTSSSPTCRSSPCAPSPPRSSPSAGAGADLVAAGEAAVRGRAGGGVAGTRASSATPTVRADALAAVGDRLARPRRDHHGCHGLARCGAPTATSSSCSTPSRPAGPARADGEPRAVALATDREHASRCSCTTSGPRRPRWPSACTRGWPRAGTSVVLPPDDARVTGLDGPGRRRGGAHRRGPRPRRRRRRRRHDPAHRATGRRRRACRCSASTSGQLGYLTEVEPAEALAAVEQGARRRPTTSRSACSSASTSRPTVGSARAAPTPSTRSCSRRRRWATPSASPCTSTATSSRRTRPTA